MQIPFIFVILDYFSVYPTPPAVTMIIKNYSNGRKKKKINNKYIIQCREKIKTHHARGTIRTQKLRSTPPQDSPLAQYQNHAIYTNNDLKGRDLVKPMLCVVQCFVDMCGADDNTTPLAIYHSKALGIPRLITLTDIEESMRAITAFLYNLDLVKHKKDLQQWLSYLLRIGACVLLQGMGFAQRPSWSTCKMLPCCGFASFC